jgi:hypothetical protein
VKRSYSAGAIAVLGVVVSVAGCAQQSTDTSATANSPAPPAANQVDARWMGLGTSSLWDWELVDRKITPDFQQFGVRRLDSTEKPRSCGSCDGHVPTAILMAFSPGSFDPTEARSGQPVKVDGRDGFFRPSAGDENAVLTWSYADDAWATLHGRSPDTSELDVMVALAGDLRPTERTPVRMPLSLTKVPAGMPLSSITGQHSDWPTIVEFSACRPRGYRIPPAECTDPNGTLSIKIWPKDDSFESTDDDQFPSWTDGAIATAIGGTDGLYNAASSEAGVQIRPEMVATFEIADPDGGPRPTTNLQDILATVQLPTDPGNEETWPLVEDWTE